jgi:hypothetical protein
MRLCNHFLGNPIKKLNSAVCHHFLYSPNPFVYICTRKSAKEYNLYETKDEKQQNGKPGNLFVESEWKETADIACATLGSTSG